MTKEEWAKHDQEFKSSYVRISEEFEALQGLQRGGFSIKDKDEQSLMYLKNDMV